jgi:hypothetical protein
LKKQILKIYLNVVRFIALVDKKYHMPFQNTSGALKHNKKLLRINGIDA